MNPWKIIGWIVLAFMGLVLYACVKVAANLAPVDGGSAVNTPTRVAAAAPSYTVKVVSVECDASGRDRADITVQNTGTATIPYAKAFAEFTSKSGGVDSAQDSYFRPHDIPPGARASATVYSNGSGSHKCGLVRIQDGDGNQVTLQ